MRKFCLIFVFLLLHASLGYAEDKALRVISLAPSTTEILFALGLDQEIVAVSRSCNYPPQALTKEKVGTFSDPDIEKILSEVILISVGRSPNTGGMGLEKAGVIVKDGRIIVDEYLKTSAPDIFAVGDCIGRYNLAHAASAEGKAAARNALGKKTAMDYGIMPVCVYSFPEAASVGLNADEAGNKGYETVTGRAYFTGSGRALAQRETEGFVKLTADKKTGKILGAQILGYNASELIGIISVAIKGGLSLKDLADVVQPHPAFSEAVQEAASAMSRNLK